MELSHHFTSEQPRASVLLAHGFGEHSGRYSEFIDALTSSAFDVWTFDFRGHGTAEGKRGNVDVGALIGEHLEARRALAFVTRTEKTHLFGHSMGGLITLASAILDPHRISSIAVTGPAVQPKPALPLPVIKAAAAVSRLLPWLPTVKVDESLLTHDTEKASLYGTDPLVFDGHVPLRTAATMARQGAYTIENAALLTRPTLILHGSEDVLADVAGSRAFVERSGGKAQLRIIEGAYHELLNEIDRKEIIEELVDWYQQW